LKIVFDNSFDTINVMITPSIIIPRSISTEIYEFITPDDDTAKNIVISDMIVGNRPLQGTKLLVRIAIIRSRGESMIRQPVTPTALQPKPMDIVRACLPHVLHFLKQLSRLNAILGRYPRSSSSVNIGKNIAIGGSITDITHPSTLKTPKTNILQTHSGARINQKMISEDFLYEALMMTAIETDNLRL